MTRPSPPRQTWPAFVAFALVGLGFVWLFVRTDPPASPAVIAAPGVSTLWIVTATNTPTSEATQTPYVRIVTATSTPEPPTPPMCSADLPPGTICTVWHAAPTATPIPACSPGTTARVCRVPGDGAVSGKDETG